MCKTVTNTITFCHTRALGMQIQKDTINNRKRKKDKEGEQNAISHFSGNVLIDTRLMEAFLLRSWAAEPTPCSRRRG